MNKINFFEFLNKIKIPAIFTIIFVLFKDIIEKFISNFLVTPILSKMNLELPSVIIFFLIVLVIFYFVIDKIKKSYYIPFRYLVWSGIILFIYFYYRISNETWSFISLKYISFFKYLDIIPVFLFGIFIIRIFYRKSKINNENKDGLIYDNPLGKNGIDLLNRTKTAEIIANKISNTDFKKSSFAIGISSEWGGGKTSFLDLLEKSLITNSNIIIKVNPWINHNSNYIIKDFFNTLSKELKKYNPDFENLFKKYINILISLNSNNKIIESINNLTNSQKTIIEEFNSINNAIEKINKKIIIFIDDLDRLYQDEIIQVIKLIRNSANFNNTFFIVAYDKNYLNNALKNINEYKYKTFLEKIFQLEIQLPNYDLRIIKNKVWNLLSPSLIKKDKKELEEILFNSTISNYYLDFSLLRTFRDATRFSNSFLISYEHLKGEIDLIDLFNIEILRLKFPELYKLIFYNSDKYLETKNSPNFKTVYILKKNTDNNKLLIETELKENKKTYNFSNQDIERIINLLILLFPYTKNPPIYREVNLISVSSPIGFDRYSYYRLLDSNLSIVEFSKYRSKSLKEFCSQIDKWIEKNLSFELEKRFMDIKEYSDKEDFEKIIKSIFYFANKFENSSNKNNIGYEFFDLYRKISDYEKLLNLNYYESEEEYINFITEIFKTAKSPYLFEADFINSIFNHFTLDYNFIISKDTLKKIILGYFKKYLIKATTLDDNIWRLYLYNDLIEPIKLNNNQYEIKKTKNPEATKLFIEFIKNKALDDFLCSIIKKRPNYKNNSQYIIINIIPQMFGSYEKFESFILSFNENEYEFLKEFKIFFKKLKISNFKNFIEFEFKNYRKN